MWLSRQRAEVLSALALVATSRQALPEGLDRLAADDPLLRPWAQRLGADLRQGRPLAEVLRRHRLIGQADADALAADERAGRIADGLARVAEGQRAGVRGVLLVTWLPVWAAVVMSLGFIVASGAAWAYMEQVGGPVHLAQLVGVRAPDVTWQDGVAHMMSAVAIIAVAWWLLGRMPVLRHVRALVYPTIHRQVALVDLLRQARGAAAALPIGASLCVRIEAMIWWFAWRPGRLPAWRWRWHHWMLLTRHRLAVRQRAGLRALRTDGMLADDLTAHLVAVGAVETASPAAVAAAQRREEDRLRRMMASAVGQVVLLLAALAALALMLGVMGPLSDHVLALADADPWSSRPPPSDTEVMVWIVVRPLLWLGGALMVCLVACSLWSEAARWFGRAATWRSAAAVLSWTGRTGASPSEALSAQAHACRGAHAARLHDAASRLDRGEPMIEALAGARLLPRSALGAGRAASDLGPQAMAAWLAQNGSALQGDDRHAVEIARLFAELLVAYAITAFLAIFIIPKIQMIFYDLNVPLPDMMIVVISVSDAVADGLLPVSILVVVLWAGLRWLPWRLPMPDLASPRLPRARLILAASTAGRSESDIATALAQTFRRPPPTLQAAGQAGDLPGLCAACGWRVPSLAALAAAVSRAEAAAAQRIRMLGLVVYTAGPLLLAAVVGTVVIAVMQTLVSMVITLTELA
jgi:hypothetical protein